MKSMQARVRLLQGILSVAILLLMTTGCPPVPPVIDDPVIDDPVIDDGDATQEVLDLEQRAFELINDERTSRGIPALDMRQTVREVARAHSEDMANNGFFDHTNLQGESPFDRMDAAGIAFTTAGENIASNFGFSNPAERAVSGWMNSEGHRNNILNANFTGTGMGVAVVDGKAFFTQLFLAP